MKITITMTMKRKKKRKKKRRIKRKGKKWYQEGNICTVAYRMTPQREHEAQGRGACRPEVVALPAPVGMVDSMDW